MISEKTDGSELFSRENRSMLSSHGSLVSSLSKIEHSIGLTQLASRVDFAMHAETSNGDDPFAKVKGLTRLEEKASEDATHKAFEATHIFSSMHSETEMVRYMTMSQHKDLYLTTSMISFVLCSWPEVKNIMLMCDMKIKWRMCHSMNSRRTRQETEDVEENKTKSLIIVDKELVAVKHHRAWVDKADENSQSLEIYNAMRTNDGE